MNDVYANGYTPSPHSLRYIYITAKNVVGILNRVASLMRRRRYNMEEVSVSFDSEGFAHIIAAIDGELLDVEQVMHQIAKLHDILDVYDATHKQDKLLNGFYVQAPSEKAFEDFPQSTLKIVKNKDNVTGIFAVSLEETPAFLKLLDGKKYYYIRRVLSLI